MDLSSDGCHVAAVHTERLHHQRSSAIDRPHHGTERLRQPCGAGVVSSSHRHVYAATHFHCKLVLEVVVPKA